MQPIPPASRRPSRLALAAIVVSSMLAPAALSQATNDDLPRAQRQRGDEVSQRRRADALERAAQQERARAASREYAAVPTTNEVVLSDDGYAIERLTFKGGTLGDLLDLLGTKVDLGTLNLVLKGDAIDIPVAPLRLRYVTIDALLEFVAPTLGSTIMTIDGKSWSIEQHNLVYGAEVGGNRIRTITYRKSPFTGFGESEPERVFEVLSLAEIRQEPDLAEAATSAFLDLIETAIVATDDLHAEIDFHVPSGLVVARVSPAQRDLLLRAYDEFRGPEVERQRFLGELRKEAAAQRREVEAFRTLIEELRAELEAMPAAPEGDESPRGVDDAFELARRSQLYRNLSGYEDEMFRARAEQLLAEAAYEAALSEALAP